jgi:hypothetical protein
VHILNKKLSCGAVCLNYDKDVARVYAVVLYVYTCNCYVLGMLGNGDGREVKLT